MNGVVRGPSERLADCVASVRSVWIPRTRLFRSAEPPNATQVDFVLQPSLFGQGPSAEQLHLGYTHTVHDLLSNDGHPARSAVVAIALMDSADKIDDWLPAMPDLPTPTA